MAESQEPADSTFPSTPLLSCGAQASEHGPVVGCCHVCGLLLCQRHAHYLPHTRHFGVVDGQGARPLVCGSHVGFAGEPLPESPAAFPKTRARSRRETLLKRPARRPRGGRS